MTSLFRIQLVVLGSPSQNVKSKYFFFTARTQWVIDSLTPKFYQKKYILALFVLAFGRFLRFNFKRSKNQMTRRIENPPDYGFLILNFESSDF